MSHSLDGGSSRIRWRPDRDARFRDRTDAGQRLARLLGQFRGGQTVVLGLPRGGVPVAFEVARTLRAPLDLIAARKVGAPGYEEYGIGAVAQDVVELDEPTIRALGVSREYLARTVAQEQAEARRRETVYREGRPAPQLTGKTVLLVDDGLATGLTARAAVKAIRKENPTRIVFAAPVCSASGAKAIGELADHVVCQETPPDFHAVSLWYDDFAPTDDREVIELLRSAAKEYAP